MAKILIANRGEIALRIAHTIKALGHEAVGIFSSKDADAPYLKYCHEAYHLPGDSLMETYLCSEKIITIAKKCNATHLHPGYGLLSERSFFAREVTAAGIHFMGPSAKVMELMGDKKTSKQYLADKNIPLVPGYHGNDQTPSLLLDEAKKVGFPLLIKASAGGGGKGMRLVTKEQDFLNSLESCKREAKNAFGDDLVLLEHYVASPRHIEVQVFGDGNGNAVHFFERECSIQRRHQKIIEESPSPALTPEKREEICQTAVSIAAKLKYYGAGTVEFIYSDVTKNFYFMEMNTRLQVEHPVTELLTGWDLVKLQIDLSLGKPLPPQSAISARGSAIEVRLYAENPDRDFLPEVGSFQQLGLPHIPGIRYDFGYEEGDLMPTDYDPMIGKILSQATTRDYCIDKLKSALREIKLNGIHTNLSYLYRILNHPVFRQGDFNTHFVNDYQNDLKSLKKFISPEQKIDLIAELVAFGGTNHRVDTHHQEKVGDSTWSQLPQWRLF